MCRCCFSPDSMAPVNRVLLYRYRNTESRVQVYQNSKTGHELQFKANCFILGVFVNITIKIKNTTLCIIQTFAMWGKMMLPSWRNRLLKISLIFFFSNSYRPTCVYVEYYHKVLNEHISPTRIIHVCLLTQLNVQPLNVLGIVKACDFLFIFIISS